MKTPIIDALLKYNNENVLRLHMPGHKGKTQEFNLLETIKENLYSMDLTEVEDTDNLHNCTGIIKESQNIASNIYKCDKSFYLVNGSTAGIYSMILSCVNKGDKIIVQRNCHKSVFMAAFLGELDIEYISPTVSKDFLFGASLNLDEVRKVVKENLDAKAVIITSPSYYGTCVDIKAISKIVKEYNMLLLVDSAHGAHFVFSDFLPNTAIQNGADMEVISVHKTLPSLTQTGILNISSECSNKIDISKLKFLLGVYQSSSPSYILMSSIEASISIMEGQGKELLENLIDEIELFKAKFKSSNFYNIVDESIIGKDYIFDIDKTRIVISSRIGGKILSNILRHKYKIQVEMADLKNIVIIGSVFDTADDYIRLYNVLSEIEKDYNNIKEICFNDILKYTYKKCIKISEAYSKSKESVLIKNSEDKICGELITPYPPGIPLIVPGELITKDKIEYIIEYKRLGIEIDGIDDDFIKVIK